MKIINGSWELDLGGICYRELWELGELLSELGGEGSIDGVKFDLETLKAGFNANSGVVYLYDAEGNTTGEENE